MMYFSKALTALRQIFKRLNKSLANVCYMILHDDAFLLASSSTNTQNAFGNYLFFFPF